MKQTAALLFLCFFTVSLSAGERINKSLKKAQKATCTIMTYDSEGTLLHTSQGFFVGEEGDVITSYDSFLHATTAMTVDAAGISRPIQMVVGANELYNVLRATVETDKKLRSLSVDSIAIDEGTHLYLSPVPTAKKETGTWLTVSKVEKMNEQYSYYTLTGPAMLADLAGRPLLTEDGQVVAVMQPSVEGDSIFYALDTRYVTKLEIKALTLNEPSYRNLDFVKALPKELDQAQVYLFMAESQEDKDKYAKTVEMFIHQFPDTPDGYLQRAALRIAQGGEDNYALAEADHAKAMELAENKDDIHYQIGRQIASAVKEDSTFHYKNWSLDYAAQKMSEAIQINPLPAYYQMLGDIRFTQGNCPAALEAYLAICHLKEATADNYYNAAITCEQMADSIDHAVALMDTAVLMASGVNKEEEIHYQSAPYVYERALMKARNGKNRSAVNDLNLFEKLNGTSMNDQFYYMREQVEAASRMFQQALDDIDMAISIKALPIYVLEKASLNIRVGRNDEAIPLLEALVAAYPEDPDCNRMLGYCLAIRNDITHARIFLQKAVDLGDPNAASLLEKYAN